MAILEKVHGDWLADFSSLRLNKVEVAQFGTPRTIWFEKHTPVAASIDESIVRRGICQDCVLNVGRDGDFSHATLMQIVVVRGRCTGIEISSDESVPFRSKLGLEAIAPPGTFSKPDPRAVCANSAQTARLGWFVK